MASLKSTLAKTTYHHKNNLFEIVPFPHTHAALMVVKMIVLQIKKKYMAINENIKKIWIKLVLLDSWHISAPVLRFCNLRKYPKKPCNSC